MSMKKVNRVVPSNHNVHGNTIFNNLCSGPVPRNYALHAVTKQPDGICFEGIDIVLFQSNSSLAVHD